MEGKIDGQFRILKDAADPGSAAIFANYPAPYSSASVGLVEEVNPPRLLCPVNKIISLVLTDFINHNFYARYLCYNRSKIFQCTEISTANVHRFHFTGYWCCLWI